MTYDIGYYLFHRTEIIEKMFFLYELFWFYLSKIEKNEEKQV